MTEELIKAFASLELNPAASPNDVRSAYLDLVKVWHPDRYQNESDRFRARAEEKLKEITLAYEKLRGIKADLPLGEIIPMDFGDRWGFVDEAGRIVIHPEYVAARPFQEGLAAVKMVEKWGFVDYAGQFRVNPLYDECGDFAEGLAAVRWYGRWGYIDKTGVFTVQPRFQEVGEFKCGYARVRMGARWGRVSRGGVAEFAGGAKIDFR
jgi:hypothetical protein